MIENDDGTDACIQISLERAASALEEIYETVAGINASQVTVEVWQDASAKIGLRLSDFDKASAQINMALGIGGAQQRILTYLRRRLSERVRMEELRGVAAIYEWARRVRELRVEKGWPIVTRTQRPDLNDGEYVLEAAEPDRQIADDWLLAKRMRNLRKPNGRQMSGKYRGLEYLKQLSPRAADKDQLNYVMQIKSYARRLRELGEEGWQIISNVDDPALAPGAYHLQSLDRRPPRVRKAIRLRHEILHRDNYRCKDDGRSPDEHGVTLQIHHLKLVSRGGTNDPANLVTLCADCHAGKHALARGNAKDELLNPMWYEEALEDRIPEED